MPEWWWAGQECSQVSQYCPLVARNPKRRLCSAAEVAVSLIGQRPLVLIRDSNSRRGGGQSLTGCHSISLGVLVKQATSCHQAVLLFPFIISRGQVGFDFYLSCRQFSACQKIGRCLKSTEKKKFQQTCLLLVPVLDGLTPGVFFFLFPPSPQCYVFEWAEMCNSNQLFEMEEQISFPGSQFPPFSEEQEDPGLSGLMPGDFMHHCFSPQHLQVLSQRPLLQGLDGK